MADLISGKTKHPPTRTSSPGPLVATPAQELQDLGQPPCDPPLQPKIGPAHSVPKSRLRALGAQPLPPRPRPCAPAFRLHPHALGPPPRSRAPPLTLPGSALHPLASWPLPAAPWLRPPHSRAPPQRSRVPLSRALVWRSGPAPTFPPESREELPRGGRRGRGAGGGAGGAARTLALTRTVSWSCGSGAGHRRGPGGSRVRVGRRTFRFDQRNCGDAASPGAASRLGAAKAAGFRRRCRLRAALQLLPALGKGL